MMIEYIILVAVIAAGVMGIIITKNMFGSNEIHGKLKNRYLKKTKLVVLSRHLLEDYMIQIWFLGYQTRTDYLNVLFRSQRRE